MTTQKSRPWELKVSSPHLVIVLGLVTGSMAAAFYLGFSSGHHVGYESALHATLTNMARLPIPAEDIDPNSANDSASDVYAKLAGNLDSETLSGGKDLSGEDIPELGAIAPAESLPILPDALAIPSVESATGKPLAVDLAKESAEPSAGERTLGSLVEEDRHLINRKAVKAEKDSTTVARESLKPSVAQEDAIAKIEVDSKRVVQAKVVEEPKVSKSIEKVEKRAAPEKKVERIEKIVPKEAEVLPTKNVPTKKESTSLVRSVIPSGWYVQVAAPRKLEEANQLAGALKRAKISVMIEAAQVRGESYYRVIAGPQSQRQGAEKLLSQIKSTRSVKGDPFIRAVK